MLNNQLRRQLLERHKQSGFPGSIIDVYKAYEQGVDVISNFEQQQMQQQMQVAQTPQQQQAGLRPFHQAGNTSQSMVFPNVPPNTPFNTVGMKAPINIEKYDKQGHLVKSYENVPPGIENLPTGPSEGTVIETPANMQSGGIKPAPRMGTRKNADGTESTHLYATETLDGKNWVAFPTLFQNPDSSWIDMSGPEWYPAYQEALKRGEVIDFGKRKNKALKWGEGSWKDSMQSGGKKKYQSGGSDERLYPEFPINLLPAEIVANIPEAPSEKIPWYSTINVRKWGLRDYGDDVKFGKAFRDAFNRGEEQFVWRGDRFSTKMKSSEDIKQTSPTINAEPQIPKFDYDLFKRGVKYVESKDGVESLMMNPKSTATGLYGQRYSELVEFPQFKNLPREVFARDTALQNKVLDMRVKGKFEGIPGVEDSAKDLYLEYKDQIKDFPYDVTEIGALVNFLGRQGAREYFGYVLRDKKPLENIFPKLYGPKKEQPNKTPEKYIEEFRSRYLLGGNLNNYPRYPKKVSYNNKRSN
jgi:uncharacterized membrane protein (UPF0127 family)